MSTPARRTLWIAVWSALAAIAFGVLGTGVAVAADRPSITLKVSPGSVTIGGSVSATGIATDEDGQPLDGLPVTIERRLPASQDWSTVATGTTDSAGAYSTDFEPRRSTIIRAVIQSPLDDSDVYSPRRSVLVRPVVASSVRDTSLLLADRVVITGTITPKRPYSVVKLQRKVGNQWRTAAGTKTRSDSSFKAWRTVMSDADLPWRVMVPSDGVFASGYGSSRTVTVRASLNSVVSKVWRSDVKYSWRTGCPVHYSALRKVTMNYRSMSGGFARGTIIVRDSAVNDTRAIFGKAFSSGFRMRSISTIEKYYDGGRRSGVQADIASMNADNTSAFNCRAVVGHPSRRSAHSWGDALDVNPRENPYVTGGRVYPAAGKSYLNRSSHKTGMLFSNSALVVEAKRRGWTWWGPMRDYHHISRRGG